MTTEILLLSFISLALLFLLIECATEGIDALRFFFYKDNSTASVVGKEPFSVSHSKRLVEQNENRRGYFPVRTTQDKNSNYPYFFSPGYWLYRKKEVFPTLEWGTEGSTWRAHYPYARKWAAGSQVTVRYNASSPWKYAVRDSFLGLSILLKCSFCLLCILLCSILLLARIRG
ncbi:MAG: hypothetical protein HFI99_17960 [Lachnospiraceae bacterium]|jgi:hypothetical protein|nr:hypothetical protein [Lachnospiraceae bacterium]MCI9327874.1 hypothetical protein [Lachnospiraceae bacterium]